MIVLCSFNGNDFRDTFLGFGEIAFDEDGRIGPPADKSPERRRAEAASSPELGSFLYYTYWTQRNYPEVAQEAVRVSRDYLDRIWKVARDRRSESPLNQVLNNSALARMARTVYVGAVGPGR